MTCDKNGLGYIFRDSFTFSSGRPEGRVTILSEFSATKLDFFDNWF
jgi:hypothetical protein